MIQYPSTLPVPMRDGYELEHVDTAHRSQIGSGRGQARPGARLAPTVVSVKWRLKKIQAQLFEGFYRHTLLDGMHWFECPLQTPLGVNRYMARFVGMYSGPKMDAPGAWTISGRLELDDRQTVEVV